MRLSIIGYTGCGKSTVSKMIQSRFVREGKRAEVVKLAYPLYALQQEFYRTAGVNLEFWDQDQVLLETIATHLRRISPTSLVSNFMERLAAVTSDVVINDDLRDPHVDYPALRDEGFRFIRVTCDESVREKRLGYRQDRTTVLRSSTTSRLDLISPHAIIDNSGSLNELERKVEDTLTVIA